MAQPQQHKEQADQPPTESKAAAWLEWQRGYQDKASFQVWFLWHRYGQDLGFDDWLRDRFRRGKGEQ